MMQVRWSFFIALPAGLILALVGYIGLFRLQLGIPTQQSRWGYEMIQKKRKRAEAITGPKLLVVGGSSVLFGLNAEEIQRQTGYPTVNLGTHAAFSLAYMFDMTRQVARSGDTVLLVLEYELYRNDPRILRVSTDAIFIDYIVARDPEFVDRLPWWERFNLAMLTSGPRIQLGLENRFGKSKDTPPHVAQPVSGIFNAYLSENISEFGDQSGATKARRPAKAPARARLSSALAKGFPENPAGFPTIRAFCDWAKASNVRVLATFPNTLHLPEYDRPEAQEAPRQIRDFFGTLGVPVLGEAADAILPEDEFFDTMYHLTEEACLTRTRRLLPHLTPYLRSSPGVPANGVKPDATPGR
jgi:hypothetical protein